MNRLIFFPIICLLNYGVLHSKNSEYEQVSGIQIHNLRCEYLVNPLGIDVVKPRLSWILESQIRDQKQTAYRILVASSTELLAKGKGDLWDSKKVNSDQSIQIEYTGRPLLSKQPCFWKVMVWDKDGKPSEWSKSATWSMGLLNASDWGDAKWIAYHNPLQPTPMKRHFGYQSWVGDSVSAEKWVTIDLGKTQRIDAVQLFPVIPYGEYQDSMIYYKRGWRPDKPYNTYGWQPDNTGYLFPKRFRIEVSRKADFSDARIVVDRTAIDIPNPEVEALTYEIDPVRARYVRLIATHLANREGNRFGFALAEMKVFSGDKNVAEFCNVSALDSVIASGWSPGRLVDGRLCGELGAIDSLERPATMVRKEFTLKKTIKRATAYVTGLGLYELHINGLRVGDHLLAPEWTNYRKRIQYQTFDVTDMLNAGDNAIGAQISGGWWSGPLTIESPLEDPRFCLLMRLEVEFIDGTNQVIESDQTWQATDNGPIRRADIYFGERYDATKEMPGWNQPIFNSDGWLPVKVLEYPDKAKHAKLVAQYNEPIRIIKELQPIKITEPKPGIYVFDMGQNFAGWCRLQANEPAGAKIKVRYAEVLNPDGTLYTDNLRGAEQINEYTWRGGHAALEPHFTYHGFRYIEVSGLSDTPTKNTITGKVFNSSSPETGSFECSNDLVNKIMENIKWTQRANMQSAPTDCPQRTERFGFLGDIQVFSQTAIFNMDMAGFFTKWVADVYDSQTDEGCFPNLAPHPSTLHRLVYKNTEFAPGWSDAGVIIPWRMYENYADNRMIKQYYEDARKWVDFIYRYNPDFIWRNNRGQDCSDWLNGDMMDLKGFPHGIGTTPHDVFATIFFAHSTQIVYKMANVLGRKEDAKKYNRLFTNIKAEFNKEFITNDGRIKGNTQGGYALALHFNLIHESMRPKVIDNLLKAINKYNNHLSTGIQATHRLLLELSDRGYFDEAWRLINLRTAPSLGYMVEMGATTVWERWDGFVQGRGFQNPNMNSFNHMAFGSVGEWVWRNLVGINPDIENPGYKHFFIKPRLADGLTWVNGSYKSIYGAIVSNWKLENNRFLLDLTVPVNTTATVYLPAKEKSSIMESGQNISHYKNIIFLRMEAGYAVLEVNSGKYSFSTMFK